MKSLKIILSVLPFFLASTSFAAEHEVQMLNKGSDGGRMVFEPAFVVAEPRGYLITFVSVDKGNNSESMAVPDGAEGWKGKISKDMSVTVQADCVYAFKCAPDFRMGMIGFVVVGDAAVNLEEVEGLRYVGRTKKVPAELIEQIKASGKPRARISSVTAIGSGTFITAPNRW
ncbi:MAG: pseudoazurin, partial [Geminicoccaceae bacterium]